MSGIISVGGSSTAGVGVVVSIWVACLLSIHGGRSSLKNSFSETSFSFYGDCLTSSD